MAQLNDMLVFLRKRKGLSQQELADRLKISRSTIGMYETGKREPDLETLEALADFYNVDMNTLTGNSRNSVPISSNQNITDFCFVQYAGPIAAHFNSTPTEEHEYRRIPPEWLGHRRPEDFFVATVNGDSMYPHYHDGDEILCLRCSDMGHSGRIGIIVFGNDEATLKRIEYQPGEDWIDLVPVNPEYTTKRLTGIDLEQCRIVGRVIKVIRTVDEA